MPATNKHKAIAAEKDAVKEQIDAVNLQIRNACKKILSRAENADVEMLELAKSCARIESTYRYHSLTIMRRALARRTEVLKKLTS